MLFSVGIPLWPRFADGQTPALFTFQNRFWLNLHHFLYVLGRAKNNSPDSRRSAVAGAITDRAGFENLSAEDRMRWEHAVLTYSTTVSAKDLTFDRPLAVTTRRIAAIDDTASAPPEDLDRDVQQALRDAAPAYRGAWWESHLHSNWQRIGELEVLRNRYGDRIAPELARFWMHPWRAAGFDVQVAAYSNWAGAYSS